MPHSSDYHKADIIRHDSSRIYPPGARVAVFDGSGAIVYRTVQSGLHIPPNIFPWQSPEWWERDPDYPAPICGMLLPFRTYASMRVCAEKREVEGTCIGHSLSDDLPPHFRIYDAFAICAALWNEHFDPEIVAPALLASMLGWNPASELPRDNMDAVAYLEAFRDRWTGRAVMQYGRLCYSLCRNDKFEDMAEVEGYLLRGIAGGLETEATLAGASPRRAGRAEFLRSHATEAREAVTSWYTERGVPVRRDMAEPRESAQMSNPVPGLPTPFNDPLTNSITAVLCFAALFSEGELLRSVMRLDDKRRAYMKKHTGKEEPPGIRSRVQLREAFQETQARADALYERFKNPPDPSTEPTPLTDAEQEKLNWNKLRAARRVPVVCPVCGFLIFAGRCMAMEDGINIGFGRCIACAASLELRAYNGEEPDAAGPEIRAFVKGEEPEGLSKEEVLEQWELRTKARAVAENKAATETPPDALVE